MLWNRIKAMLDDSGSGREDRLPDTDLATAVLLYEIARADHHVADDERACLQDLLRGLPDVDEADIAELIERAADRVDQEVSLHQYLDTLNQRLDADGKRRLIRMIWQLAYADGVLDPLEEKATRRLADLLFVPHSVFIQEKLAAQQAREDAGSASGGRGPAQ